VPENKYMPQILDLEVGPGSRIGVWKIEEDPEELKWKLQWSAEDIRKFRSHNDGERSKHWLYSRILLREMLNTSKFIELEADEYGKPFLVNFPQKLSISHSGDMVAVMLSDFNCGMDIQLMKTGVIEKVAHKFVSTEEWHNIHEDDRNLQLYLVWCCKEALYKYYGKKALDFKENLFLYPFIWTPDGSTRGQIMKKDYFKELPVSWKKIENYLLAWTLG
jgi:4'-phosphopantetheinyl transferase